MKVRFPLYAKILVWFLVNLVVVGAVFLWTFRQQFGTGSEWLLTQPARDRIQALSELALSDLRRTPPAEWDSTLKRYSDAYHVELTLCGNNGTPMAGRETKLPKAVIAKLGEQRGSPGFRRDRGVGPPEDRDVRQPDEPPARGDRRNRPGDELGPLPRRPGPAMFPRSPDREGEGPTERHFPMQILRTKAPDRYWLLVRFPPRALNQEMPQPSTLLLASDSMALGGMLFDPRPWLLAGGGALLFTALFWFPLVRGITRSLAEMNQATVHIAEGQFDTRLASDRNDELGSLAGAVNRMGTRLAGFVTGQKRFLSDIAHELCAPIARIQMALGILEQRADERQKPYVEDLREEVQHMSGLVNELLSFSRASLRPKDIQLQSVNLLGVIQRVVAREAQETGAVTIAVGAELGVQADPELLARALANLVRNAVRYAGSAGPISIDAAHHGPEVTVRVTDSGPGIPAEQMNHLFEPFFRPDAARTREGGGTGLGLAIVKSCVDACQGRIVCRNLEPRGFQAEITMQAAPGTA